MDLLESNLEDIVCNYFDKLIEFKETGINDLDEYDRGLCITPDLYIRQFDLTPYGIIDILTVTYDLNTIAIDIIELKKNIIDINAAMQISRYMSGIKQYWGLIRTKISNKRINSNLRLFVKGHLIAPKIQKDGDFVFLYNELRNISIYEMIYDSLEGVRFEKVDKEWYITDKQDNVLRNVDKFLDKHSDYCEEVIQREKEFALYQIQNKMGERSFF